MSYSKLGYDKVDFFPYFKRTYKNSFTTLIKHVSITFLAYKNSSTSEQK